MNNQDQDTRFQKYDFTPKRSKAKRRRRPPIWPWILGLVIIVLILTFGIRYILDNSSQVTNDMPKSEYINKKDKNTNNQTNTDNSKIKTDSDKQAENAKKAATQSDNNQAATPNNGGSDEFGINHTFNSLQDAKDWASATKSEWTAAGYNYWVVNQNSQGYFVLTFTK